ncbi:MAG: HPr family phosphocarrier protein [Planctomycetes bacterium]|nr:HPr family phosphocarrier protein [Planctomycetota bacterium]
MKHLLKEEMPELNPTEKDGFWYQDLMVLNKHGLHARPSAQIYEKILMPYGDDLEMNFHIEGRGEISIKSVFDLMSLGLEAGTKLTVQLRYHGDGSLFDDAQAPAAAILKDIYDLFLNSFSDLED